MDRFLINGGKPLSGKVRVRGAKNAVLPLMAASILVQGKYELHSVPAVRDVKTMMRILGVLGIESDLSDEGILTLDSSNLTGHEAPYKLVRTMRASFEVLGPILTMLGKARVSLPGGCTIGARPVDIHLKGLQAMGADIQITQGYVEAQAEKLRGGKIFLDFPSVGATRNLMMAATLAEGETTIENAAREPEVEDLANFLNACGAQITGAGSDAIEIEGVVELRPDNYTSVPDRIEAGTFLIAAAITGGDVLVEGARREHLETLIAKLEESGVSLEIEEGGIRVSGDRKLQPSQIKTLPYPGFPTDLQPPMTALLTLAEGTSTIAESIYENRHAHVGELIRMGADIEQEGRTAIIRGVDHLSGASVMASDIRCGAGLVIAALAAEGKSEINRAYHIDRGHEKLEENLQGLGADIERVN